jgi:hypothetical protein
MSDVMAIVSKAVFEKAAGKGPVLGHALGLDRYTSANKGLTPLAGGGRLFLVTVRPPDEALWLVAVLDHPSFSGKEWIAAGPCATPMTDISALKPVLRFESGKGLPTATGTLGMSLQTPRVLTAGDVTALLGALAAPGGAATATGAAAPTAAAAIDPQLALRAAVLAAPRDDAPRRALVAHWRTAGEPRGELAEVDLALRDRLSVSRRRALRARHAELLAAHATRWWPWPVTWRQRGGFVVAVRAHAGSFLGLADAIFAAEPVIELELQDVDEETVAEVARAGWLARVAVLTIRGPIGDEGFATLLKSRHLAGLEALNVSANELSAEGLAALRDRLPRLRRLCLTANAIGDDGAALLAAWPHLAHVDTLYLSACELSERGVRALTTSGKLGALTRLTLAQNDLGDAGIAALAEHAASMPHLRHLELIATQLREAGAAALAAARFPAMRRLDLRGNWFTRAALQRTYRDALRV